MPIVMVSGAAKIKRRRQKMTPAALGTCFIFWLLLVSPDQAGGQTMEPSFHLMGYETGELAVRVSLLDSLPAELLAYINKGVPVLFHYQLELWRERNGWLDELRGRQEISYKVRFDPWEKEYSITRQSPELLIENRLRGEREALDLVKTTGPVSFETGDTSGVFYLSGEVSVKTMSFSNFKEVESWLKGGVSDLEKPRLQDAPDKLGEFVFDMALRVTGFKNSARAVKSHRFRLNRAGFVLEND